jgi:hypothetical protein
MAVSLSALRTDTWLNGNFPGPVNFLIRKLYFSVSVGTEFVHMLQEVSTMVMSTLDWVEDWLYLRWQTESISQWRRPSPCTWDVSLQVATVNCNATDYKMLKRQSRIIFSSASYRMSLSDLQQFCTVFGRSRFQISASSTILTEVSRGCPQSFQTNIVILPQYYIAASWCIQVSCSPVFRL